MDIICWCLPQRIPRIIESEDEILGITDIILAKADARLPPSSRNGKVIKEVRAKNLAAYSIDTLD
jgi:hypothetical protein